MSSSLCSYSEKVLNIFNSSHKMPADNCDSRDRKDAKELTCFPVEVVCINRTYLNVEPASSISLLDTRNECLEVFLPAPKCASYKIIQLLSQRGLKAKINILGDDNVPSGSYLLCPGTQQATVTFCWTNCDGWLIVDGYSASCFPTMEIDCLPQGYSTALNSDGSIIAVGQPAVTGCAGTVAIFRQCGCKYKPLQFIQGSSPGFGVSVSFSSTGDWLACGDPISNTVIVFRRTGDQWTPTQQICAPQLTTTQMKTLTTEAFGFSLAFDAPGQTLAVGAPGSIDIDERPTQAGTIWIYTRKDDQCLFCSDPCPLYWNLVSPIVGSSHPPGYPDSFGYDLGISADGTYVVTIAPYIGASAVFTLGPDGWGCCYSKVPPLGSDIGVFSGLSCDISADGHTVVFSGDLGIITVLYLTLETFTSTPLLLPGALSIIPVTYSYSVALSGDGRTLLAANVTDCGYMVLQPYTLYTSTTEGILGLLPPFYPQPPIETGIKYSEISRAQVALNPQGGRAVGTFFGICPTSGKTLVLG